MFLEIEGSTNSINNESGGQIGTSSTTGIKNTGEIQTIENAGTIGMTGGIGIEDATGEIHDDLERKGRGNRRDRDKERKWIERNKNNNKRSYSRQ